MGKKNLFRVIESYGACKSIIFLLEHPEGIRKIDYRTKIGLASTTAIKIHSVLFEEGVIQTKSDPNNLLFVLTEKGVKIAKKIKDVDVILKEK